MLNTRLNDSCGSCPRCPGRAGGRAGTRAQPLGSQPSEPSAVLVLQREERVATTEAGSPGMDHRAQASRATRMAAVCAILGFGPSGLVWGCGFSFQEKVCLPCIVPTRLT